MKKKEFYHKTKDGKKIKLSDLELSHLKNIIRWIENHAKNGLTIQDGGGTYGMDSFWYDEDTIFGDEAKKHLKYKRYIKELKRRENVIKQSI